MQESDPRDPQRQAEDASDTVSGTGGPGGASGPAGTGGAASAPRRPAPDSESVLPEQTRDDTDGYGGDWRESQDQAGRDEWLHSERPPHWE